jgi:hypothetical protein
VKPEQEVARDLYHALISAGHANWCPALDAGTVPCRCGRTAALEAWEEWREGPVLSLASESR